MNNNINPILYNFYLHLHDRLGAIIVHRRHRKSNTSIEIIFTSPAIKEYTGRLNTLKEAEACGYWVISRRQTKGKHLTWRGHAVFQLFLSPVHPKKQHAALLATAQTAVQQLQATSNDLKQLQTISEDITFEPIIPRPSLPSRKRTYFEPFRADSDINHQEILSCSARFLLVLEVLEEDVDTNDYCACVLHHKEHGKKLPACLRGIGWKN